MARDGHRPGELPWGWWLRARLGVLEDEHGRTWRSVRDAFWQGELGFGDVHFAPEQHELMLRTLSSLDRHGSHPQENRHDLFAGDWFFWRFYMCWLGSIGMIETTSSIGFKVSPLEGGLSPEGRSVLMMLRATREPEWESMPMAEIMDIVVSSMHTAADDAREEALQAFERAIGLRRHVFARERVGRSHLVTLTGMSGGAGARMPVRRVNWSASFADSAARDDLFAWFAARVDRWDDWGEMAYSKGADAFGRHLLELLVVSRTTGAQS
ncbi:hypothetical protein [Sphingomonas sp. ABOLG]|jgi:hypothetical protein|uniref:hypothetical protein n=1 Tax=Sphingomonas sp. ABOLG TaxID=1985880 RepID=UPI001F49C09A|nr:hypothetical protein [Sphingomonas sp. ABOLG]